MKRVQWFIRYTTKAFIGLLCVCGLLFCLLLASRVGYEYFTRIPFNSVEWKAGKSSFDKQRLRGRMIADLTDRYQLRAMPREELIELLGEPDQHAGIGEWDVGWVTGSDWIDPIWFVVRFNSQERVTEYETNVNFG